MEVHHNTAVAEAKNRTAAINVQFAILFTAYSSIHSYVDLLVVDTVTEQSGEGDGNPAPGSPCRGMTMPKLK